MANVTDVSVERMQNRRGNKINLPQPLRPGEYGMCSDTRELFIGGDPDLIGQAAIQVYSAGLYQFAQNIMDQQIIVAKTTANPGDPAPANLLTDLLSEFTVNSAIADPLAQNMQYITETAELYIGGHAIPDEITPMLVIINGHANIISTSTVIGLAKTLDENGGLAFDHHSQSNAVATILNSLHTDALATTKLNVEVMTEYSTFEVDYPVDALISAPIEVVLPPAISFAAMPLPTVPAYSLIFGTASSDSIFIDYTVHYNNANTVESYSSTGSLVITTNKAMATSSLVDENTTVTNSAWDIDFQATYLPGTEEVQLEYKHNFAVGTEPVIMKLTTKRWLSF